MHIGLSRKEEPWKNFVFNEVTSIKLAAFLNDYLNLRLIKLTFNKNLL